MKKTWTLTLAALALLLTAASCGGAGEDKPTDTVETKAPDTDAAPVYLDELPADLDLGEKTYTFAYFSAEPNFLKYDVGNESQCGEIVADAVYNRNEKVMERLNFKMDRYASAAELWKDWASETSRVILAGDDVWQIMVMANNATLQSGISYCFRDLSDMPYLDIDKEYWWKDSIMQLSTDGSEYRYLLGEILLQDSLQGTATFFNKDMFTSLFDSSDLLYQTALDGKWTVDLLQQYCKEAYHDTDGSGTVNDGDQIGMRITQPWVEVLRMDYGADYRRITHEDDGHILIDFDMDRATAVYDKLYHLVNETPGLYCSEAYEQTGDQTQFTNGNTLFRVNALGDAFNPTIRNMDAKWGILPCPKFDENQENYVGVFEGMYVCVPKTVQDSEGVGAILEGLASEAHTSVMDVFYSEALMSKYSPDEQSSKCIKLVVDSLRVDFALSYSANMNYISHEVAYAVCGQTPLMSRFETLRTGGQATLDKYIENLKNAED